MKSINAILILLLIIVAWLRWFGEGGAIDYRQKQQQLKEQIQINKDLKLRNEKLKAEVEDLRNGLDAIEERARSEMGMIKKGETFIQVIEDKQ